MTAPDRIGWTRSAPVFPQSLPPIPHSPPRTGDLLPLVTGDFLRLWAHLISFLMTPEIMKSNLPHDPNGWRAVRFEDFQDYMEHIHGQTVGIERLLPLRNRDIIGLYEDNYIFYIVPGGKFMALREDKNDKSRGILR